MVSRVNVARKKNIRHGQWYPWFRTHPLRGVEGFSACLQKCQTYTWRIETTCQWGNCLEIWCGVCGRYSGGMGPVGCPCDWDGNTSGGRGHGTRAEQARPKTRRYKAR